METTMRRKTPDIRQWSALRRRAALSAPPRQPRRFVVPAARRCCLRCFRACRRATSSTRTSSAGSAPANCRGWIACAEAGAVTARECHGRAGSRGGVFGVSGGGGGAAEVVDGEGPWRKCARLWRMVGRGERREERRGRVERRVGGGGIVGEEGERAKGRCCVLSETDRERPGMERSRPSRDGTGRRYKASSRVVGYLACICDMQNPMRYLVYCYLNRLVERVRGVESNGQPRSRGSSIKERVDEEGWLGVHPRPCAAVKKRESEGIDKPNR